MQAMAAFDIQEQTDLDTPPMHTARLKGRCAKWTSYQKTEFTAASPRLEVIRYIPVQPAIEFFLWNLTALARHIKKNNSGVNHSGPRGIDPR